MTRKEEIQAKAEELYGKVDKSFPLTEFVNEENRNCFKAGAKWADNHPNAIDFAYLQNWYQDSIDETREPIWTDKHLEELFNDFYLIPKDAAIKK